MTAPVFQLTAQHYDVLYGTKEYEREAHRLREHLGRRDPSLHTILDVACGTGAHDEHLCRFFEVDGLDLRPEFLDAARARNPRGRYHVADMRDFRLDRLYDTIVCLFSSIGYARTTLDLVRTLRCFREHLTGRGVVLVEPWLRPDTFQPGVRWDHGERQDTTILRMSRSSRRGEVSHFEFHYLIGTAAGIEHSQEVHELGLFSDGQMRQALREAGLGEIEYDADGLMGRGMYVARQPGGESGS